MTTRSRRQVAVFVSLFLAVAPAVAVAATLASPSVTTLTEPQPADLTGQPAIHVSGANSDAFTGSATNPIKLPKVVATAQRADQTYNLPDTATATGIETPAINIPQSIQVIPKQVLQDQGAESLEAAVRNAPGVYVQQGEGNRDEFYIRGVKTKSDFFVDGLRDDSEYFRPLYNVAHVDVLQGPAAILFGRGGAGGVINLVTKQPERNPIREVSMATGSWDQWRATLDVGGAAGESGAYRLMAMGEHSGGFRKYDYLHRWAVNPKYNVQLGERTQLDLSFSWLDDRRLADRGIPSENGRPADVPRDQFFGAPNQNMAHSRVGALDARLKHQFSDRLEIRNAFLATENQRLYQNVYPGSPVDSAGRLQLDAYYHPTDRLSYLDRFELVADFDTGALHHKVLMGAMASWQRGKEKEARPGPSKTLPGTYPVSDPIIAPVAFDHLSRINHVVGKELGLFAEDQLSLGRHWKALVGARWDRFVVDAHYEAPGVIPDHTDHVDIDWSPRVGIIYKPIENDSIYASVTRTFTPQGANLALSLEDPSTANLAPGKATNYEIGNKLNLFDAKLSLAAALFQLDLANVVSEAANGSGALVNTGRQRNRGVELSLTGALTRHLSVYANYTHLTAEITSATEEAQAGAQAGLVPRNAFSVWARYTLTPHWGFGAGLYGTSWDYTSYSNTVVLPGYVVGDLMAYYQAGGYRLQLNLDNITDQKFYPTASGDNEIMPGAPRSVLLSLRVNF